jgi:L-iditol 2-dehydrogenase
MEYTVRVAKLYSFNDIRIEDIPIPDVGPGDALISTAACGICSGDVMPWYIEKKAPLVLGHEPAGVIIETGNEVTSFKPGDRVFVHHHAPCLSCRHCIRGNYVQCDTWRSTRIIPGGISEYILIPRTNLENDTLMIHGGVSFQDATLIEPAACIIKALKRLRITEGDTVLIIGLGAMGQMHIPLLRKYGAGKIIGADMVPYRLSKALEFGVDYVIDVSKHNLIESLKDLTHGDMADIVVVGPNSIDAMKQGIESAGPGGKVLFFTPAKPGERLSFDPNDLYFRDINIISSYSCGPADTREALDNIRDGIITAQKFVTHQFPVEHTAEAFRITAEAKNSLKCIIVFGEDRGAE